MSFTMPYLKIYILSELSANGVKFISFDRQKLDLLKYICLWYRKFYVCRDTARFYEHKIDPGTRGDQKVCGKVLLNCIGFIGCNENSKILTTNHSKLTEIGI